MWRCRLAVCARRVPTLRSFALRVTAGIPLEMLTLFGDPHLRLSTAESIRPWTPTDDPIPAVHPLGKTCSSGSMRLKDLRWLKPQPMCLLKDDYISERIKDAGYWRDCGILVKEWFGKNPGGGDMPNLLQQNHNKATANSTTIKKKKNT